MLRNTLFIGFLITTIVQGGQNVVVVLDDSGSMNSRMRSSRRIKRIDAAKSALLEVLKSVPENAKVGVLALNSQTRDSWIIPLEPVDREKLASEIQRIRAHGETPLGKKLKEGADALLKLREQEHYGDYRLLVVTDGEASDRHLVKAFLPDVLSRGITVDVIGVDMDSQHSLATHVHSYRRADDPESLRQAISEVLAESDASDLAADDSDFEMIAGIPDELATAILEALSQPNNQEIGSVPASYDTTFNRPDATRHSQPVRIPEKRAPAASRGIPWVLVLLGLVAFGVFVMIGGLIRNHQPHR